MGILEDWFFKVLQFVFMILVGSMLFEHYRSTRKIYDLGWAISFGIIIGRQLMCILALGGIIYFDYQKVNFFYPVLDQALLLLFYLFLVYTFYLERLKREARLVQLGAATVAALIFLIFLMTSYWRPFAINQVPYTRFWGNIFFSVIHLSLVIAVLIFLYLRERGFFRTWRQVPFYLFSIGHSIYLLDMVSSRGRVSLKLFAGFLFFLGYLIFAISVIGYRVQFKLIMLLIAVISLPTLLTVPLLSAEFKNSLINLGYQVFPIEEINQVIFSLKKVLYLISGMGILVASSLGYLLSGKGTSALRSLALGADKIGEGDLTTRVGIERKDEIGGISKEFDKMAKSLEDKTAEVVNKQRQVVQLERISSIGKLAGGVAHEVNNPLTGVLGCSQLGKEMIKDMKKNYPDKRLQKQLDILAGYLDTAEAGTLRCKDVTSSLLKFSRQMDPGKSETANINDIIERTLLLTQIQPAFRHIGIEKRFDSNLPKLMVNVSQISQVFLELLLNAVHSMPEGGTLTIITSREGQLMVIKFSDTGSAISKEEHDRIFTPFYTTQEAGSGRGLGLAISYGIIAAHNGNMDIESKEGQGTTISIKLPLKENERKSA